MNKHIINKYVISIKLLDFKMDFHIEEDQVCRLNRLFDILNEHFDLDIYYNFIKSIEY